MDPLLVKLSLHYKNISTDTLTQGKEELLYLKYCLIFQCGLQCFLGQYFSSGVDFTLDFSVNTVLF